MATSQKEVQKGSGPCETQPDEDPIHRLPRAITGNVLSRYQMRLSAFLLTWFSMDLIMFVHWVVEMISSACA